MATTYKKVLKTIEVNTLGGTTVESTDTATEPFASNAYVEFKNRKTMHIKSSDNETLIPFHAVDDVIESKSTTDMERSDPYCKSSDSECTWEQVTVTDAMYDDQEGLAVFYIDRIIPLNTPFRVVVGNKSHEGTFITDCNYLEMFVELEDCPPPPPVGAFAFFQYTGLVLLVSGVFEVNDDYTNASVEMCVAPTYDKITLVLQNDLFDPECFMDGTTTTDPREIFEFFEEHCHLDTSTEPNRYVTNDEYVTIVNGMDDFAFKRADKDYWEIHGNVDGGERNYYITTSDITCETK